MSDNPGRSPKGSNRLSPDELARDVVSRLQGTLSEGIERRRRIDVVTVGRIAIAIGVVLIGGGAAFAVSWIGQLSGYQTTGAVAGETSLFGCPGESELGVLFSGETVEVVGRSDDGAFLVIRDERGPGNLAFAPVGSITAVVSPDQLEVRRCQPSDPAEVAAMVQTSITGGSATTATVRDLVSTTTAAGTTSTTGTASDTGRPPARGSTPGLTATTSTTPPARSPTTTGPPGSPAPSTTSTTRPRTTTTTRTSPTTSITTTTTTTLPTTTTTTSATTTTQVTTTTTVVTTTTVGETTTTG